VIGLELLSAELKKRQEIRATKRERVRERKKKRGGMIGKRLVNVFSFIAAVVVESGSIVQCVCF